MGTQREATAAASPEVLWQAEKGGVKQTDLLARPNSLQPSQLVQDESFWHNKTCQLSAPALPHLRNKKEV